MVLSNMNIESRTLVQVDFFSLQTPSPEHGIQIQDLHILCMYQKYIHKCRIQEVEFTKIYPVLPLLPMPFGYGFWIKVLPSPWVGWLGLSGCKAHGLLLIYNNFSSLPYGVLNRLPQIVLQNTTQVFRLTQIFRLTVCFGFYFLWD